MLVIKLSGLQLRKEGLYHFKDKPNIWCEENNQFFGGDEKS